MVFAIVLLFVAAIVGVELIRRHRQQTAAAAAPLVLQPAYQMKTDRIRVPAGLYFHPSHTWGHMSVKGSVQAGIDDFILHVTGPLSKVSISAAEGNVKQGEPLITLEQDGKRLVLPSPVTGHVAALNQEVLGDPSQLARQPYGDNWLCEITPDDWSKDTRNLLLGKGAGEWLRREMTRLRDFFANLIDPQISGNAAIALQDGGEVAEGVLRYQEETVWNDFQSDFLNMQNETA